MGSSTLRPRGLPPPPPRGTARRRARRCSTPSPRGRGRPPRVGFDCKTAPMPPTDPTPRTAVQVPRRAGRGPSRHRRARGSSFAVLRGVADPVADATQVEARLGRSSPCRGPRRRRRLGARPRVPADAATRPCRAPRGGGAVPRRPRKGAGWKASASGDGKRAARRDARRREGRARATGGTPRSVVEHPGTNDRPERTTTGRDADAGFPDAPPALQRMRGAARVPAPRAARRGWWRATRDQGFPSAEFEDKFAKSAGKTENMQRHAGYVRFSHERPGELGRAPDGVTATPRRRRSKTRTVYTTGDGRFSEYELLKRQTLD